MKQKETYQVEDTLWNIIEKQLQDNEDINQNNLEYIIEFLNDITEIIHKNHKNYWELPKDQHKHFLKEIVNEI